jgi:hypothetical protein
MVALGLSGCQVADVQVPVAILVRAVGWPGSAADGRPDLIPGVGGQAGEREQIDEGKRWIF